MCWPARPWGRGFLPHGPYQLQTVVFAVQLKLAHLSDTALRVTQIGIAMLGIILVIAAVYDLAGPRAARLAAWVLAFEPANLFFNSALHKEPLMVLASGLVVLGGTKIWRTSTSYGRPRVAARRPDRDRDPLLRGLVPGQRGGPAAPARRPRRLDRPGRAMPIVYADRVHRVSGVPTLLTITSNKSLQTLQQSQNYTTAPRPVGAAGIQRQQPRARTGQFLHPWSGYHEPARSGCSTSIFRPYPWQLHNPEPATRCSRLVRGARGPVHPAALRVARQRHVLSLTAPILYPFLFLLIAYSLSAGNAGTGFRYRTHLVLLGAAMLAVAPRAGHPGPRAEAAPNPAPPQGILQPPIPHHSGVTLERPRDQQLRAMTSESTGQQDIRAILRILWRWKLCCSPSWL